MMQEINELPRIKKVAPILHNGFDLAKAFSLFTDVMENGFDFSEGTFEGVFGTIPKKSVSVGDVGDFKDFPATLLAVDDNYLDVVDHNLLIWDSATGSSDACFETLFNTPGSCILAKATADQLGITELGQLIRVTFYHPDYDYWDYGEYGGNVTLMKVVGVSGGMPGMWNFRSGSMSALAGLGILVNIPDYCAYMDWGEPYADDMIVDKILINLVENTPENLQEVQLFIKEEFTGQYKFMLDEISSISSMIESNSNTINDIMEIVLFVAIIVSLFGLISSMYSTMLERMYEIGILRAMGLRQNEVRGMLMAESLTLMISSGSLGTIIGVFIAYLLMSTVGLITELPTVLTVNWGTLALTYLISIGVGIVGILGITWRTRKWRVIDTLRFSF